MSVGACEVRIPVRSKEETCEGPKPLTNMRNPGNDIDNVAVVVGNEALQG